MHRRKQGKPIQSVALTVGFRADRKTLMQIKKTVPEARWRNGELELRLTGAGAEEMADVTKGLSDRVRAALGGDGDNVRETKSSKRL